MTQSARPTPPAELADVTVTYVPAAERSYPDDMFKVKSARSWLVTYAELEAFANQLEALLENYRKEVRG